VNAPIGVPPFGEQEPPVGVGSETAMRWTPFVDLHVTGSELLDPDPEHDVAS
jgi:hypothetical protein